MTSAVVFLLLGLGPSPAPASGPAPGPAPDVRLFFLAAARDSAEAEPALREIGAAWRDGYAGLVIDLARFFPSSRPPSTGGSPDEPAPSGSDNPLDRPGTAGSSVRAPPPPGAAVRARLVRFLGKQTGEGFGDDLGRWRRWLWSRTVEPHPDYAAFKAALYGRVDARMAEFFAPGTRSLVRLDEVDWGGVGVDGIPPLDHPAAEPAADARWLKDDHVVFGLAIGGEARAYPKRILAWHELARDRLGGQELAIVYCTLCGTVIPYAAEVGGVVRRFGTSGLLYRSNKLMYDAESMSLWSTSEGRPVIGPLAGSGLELASHPVVTTTWREWRVMHPGTTVLSIATGHERDYSEGAAYRDYFASDRLMFQVPRTDARLRNKDEVLALLLRPPGAAQDAPRQALALSRRFLEKNRLHALRFAGNELLVVTSRAGASRVYATHGRRFVRETGPGTLVDDAGHGFRLTEDALVPDPPASGLAALPRVPARVAFWFGWYAQFPDTELVR